MSGTFMTTHSWQNESLFFCGQKSHDSTHTGLIHVSLTHIHIVALTQLINTSVFTASALTCTWESVTCVVVPILENLLESDVCGVIQMTHN